MTTQMRILPLMEGPITFAGAVSLDVSPQGVQPWRLVHDDFLLYEEALRSNSASFPTGIRLNFQSDTTRLVIEFEAGRGGVNPPFRFDLLVNGKFHERVSITPPECKVIFANLPKGEHRMEVYLPHQSATRLRSVAIDADATAKPWTDTRPRWLVYGSSITQCKSADGPSETWPALVAHRFGLNLTCLGYGGNCHMEPVVTRMLRDQPADYISLCLGINVFGGSTYNARTFRAGVLGTIITLRDRHRETPMVVVTPISNPPREDKPNTVGLTLSYVRETITQAVTLLQERGDTQLHLINGLDLFGPDLAHHMPDGLHPDAQGNHVLADQYAKVVMPVFGLKDTQQV